MGRKEKIRLNGLKFEPCLQPSRGFVKAFGQLSEQLTRLWFDKDHEIGRVIRQRLTEKQLLLYQLRIEAAGWSVLQYNNAQGQISTHSTHNVSELQISVVRKDNIMMEEDERDTINFIQEAVNAWLQSADMVCPARTTDDIKNLLTFLSADLPEIHHYFKVFPNLERQSKYSNK